MDVNNVLREMHKNRDVYKKKGDLGEESVRALLLSYREKRGGSIWLSFKYPYQSNVKGKNYPGNLVWKADENKFVSHDGHTRQLEDEVDLVFVTNNRIFLIEVKARAGKWTFYDFWSKRGNEVADKCSISQTEKHARHFYHLVHEVLPDGDPSYIVPMVVYVDKAVINDKRSKPFQKYVPLTILNNFLDKVKEYDKPGKYSIDTKKVLSVMRSKGTGKEF